MGWLKNKIGSWATNTQQRELREFVQRLRPLDRSELAMIVACATHIRHHLEEARDWDLLEPALTEMRDIALAMHIGQFIRGLQSSNRPDLAAGAMVWLHTVRAASNPDLRQLGRDMWRELSRGFPDVEEQADSVAITLGMAFDTDGYDRFPAGLSPEPQ